MSRWTGPTCGEKSDETGLDWTELAVGFCMVNYDGLHAMTSYMLLQVTRSDSYVCDKFM